MNLTFLNKKIKGFNGISHMLISISLLFVMLYMPRFWSPFKEYIEALISERSFFIVCSLCILGGSLFPDLDSNRSTAVFRLGFIGQLINTFMQLTGALIWKLYHFKRDKKPSYMHRVVYHSFLFGSSLVVVPYLFANTSDEIFAKFLIELQVKELGAFFKNNFLAVFIIIFAFLNIKLLISTVSYYPFRKVFKRQSTSEFVCFVVTSFITYYMINLSFNQIRFIGISLGLGYLSHLIGDLFTKGSIPLLFPIPIKWQAYWRPNFPLQISTLEGPIKIFNRILILFILANCIYLSYRFFF